MPINGLTMRFSGTFRACYTVGVPRERGKGKSTEAKAKGAMNFYRVERRRGPPYRARPESRRWPILPLNLALERNEPYQLNKGGFLVETAKLFSTAK